MDAGRKIRLTTEVQDELTSVRSEAMTDTSFQPGDVVLTPRAQGTVIDVRATPSGKWVFGVEGDDGEVGYFTGKALRLAES